MTRSTTTIPFHDLTFLDDLPKLRDVEDRRKKFLRMIRRERQNAELDAGQITEEDMVSTYDLIDDLELRRIKRRAMRYLERLHSSTGMYHLDEVNRARLTPLRGRLP